MGTCKRNGAVSGPPLLVVKLEQWDGGLSTKAHELSRLYISDEGYVAVDHGYGSDLIGQLALRPGMSQWSMVFAALMMWGNQQVNATLN